MENTNEMKIIFDSRPENEGLARVAAAAFCTQLNPTLEEVADLKTAVSEAVTNCIIHAYEGQVKKIEIFCRREGQKLREWGSETLQKLWSLFLQQSRRKIVPGWDLHLWKRLWMR